MRSSSPASAHSLRSAIGASASDNGIVDVIKAEDIANFPDLNLAESLQRVPGVAIDRDAGEGRTITVRGLGPDFTRIRINGMEALATTGGTDRSGGDNRSRGFDFNVFASDLFNSHHRAQDCLGGSRGRLAGRDRRPAAPAAPFDYGDRSSPARRAGRLQRPRRKSDPRAALMLSNNLRRQARRAVLGRLLNKPRSKKAPALVAGRTAYASTGLLFRGPTARRRCRWPSTRAFRAMAASAMTGTPWPDGLAAVPGEPAPRSA